MTFAKTAWRLLPFWLFIVLFKFGAGIHYSLFAAIGARFLPVWEVGLIVGGMVIVQLVLDVPAGFLIDRFGPLRLLRVSIFCFLIAGVALLFPLSLTTYGVSAVFSELGWLFFLPGITTYLLSHGTPKVIGRLLSLKTATEGLGITLALLGMTWFVHFPTPVIGMLMMYPLLGALAILIIAPRFPHDHYVLDETLHARRRAKAAGLKTIFSALRALAPASWLLAGNVFCVSTIYAMFWFIIPILISRDVHPQILNGGMIILDAAAIVTGYWIGKIVDASPRRIIVLFGCLLIAVSTAFLGFSLSGLFLLFSFLLTTGDSFASLGLWAWLDDKDKTHKDDGVAIGAITLMEDVGWTIGPVLAGLLFPLIGTGPMFLLGAIPLFFLVIIILSVKNHRRRKT